jgi:hypothetical protein
MSKYLRAAILVAAFASLGLSSESHAGQSFNSRVREVPQHPSLTDSRIREAPRKNIGDLLKVCAWSEKGQPGTLFGPSGTCPLPPASADRQSHQIGATCRCGSHRGTVQMQKVGSSSPIN